MLAKLHPLVHAITNGQHGKILMQGETGSGRSTCLEGDGGGAEEGTPRQGLVFRLLEALINGSASVTSPPTESTPDRCIPRSTSIGGSAPSWAEDVPERRAIRLSLGSLRGLSHRHETHRQGRPSPRSTRRAPELSVLVLLGHCE